MLVEQRVDMMVEMMDDDWVGWSAAWKASYWVVWSVAWMAVLTAASKVDEMVEM